MLSRLGLIPAEASTMAARVDALYLFLLGVSAFFAIVIAVLIVSFAIRYRRREDNQVGEAIHGSLLLEATWSIIPFVIAMCMFAWGAKLYVSMARPPDNAMEIFVVGKQWMWKLQHMEGRREINELHVPVGVPVKLTMTSEDVIHSFYVPAFRVKADVVPGRYTTLWFQATKPGRFHLFCAEYCGTDHSRMIGSVVAMEPADFQDWLTGRAATAAAAGTGTESMAELGKEVFETQGCISCHRPAVSGIPGNGPNLEGVFGRRIRFTDGSSLVADQGYLRESIMNPTARIVAGYKPLMPTFQGRIGEEEILQLIAYIKSLAAPGEGADHAATVREAGP